MDSTPGMTLAHPVVLAQLRASIDLLRDPELSRAYVHARQSVADQVNDSLTWVVVSPGQRLATYRDVIIIRDAMSVVHSGGTGPWGAVVIGHASFLVESPDQYLAYLLARFHNVV